MRLRYFAAGLAAFVLCGFGIPGPQGSSAAFTGGDVTNAIGLASGSAAAPSLYFTGDAGNDTGLYLAAANNVGFTTNGSVKLAISGSLTTSYQSFRLRDSFGFQFGADGDVYIYGSDSATDPYLTLDGDGSGTEAARLALSSIAPMSSDTTSGRDDFTIVDAQGSTMLTVDSTGNSVTLVNNATFTSTSTQIGNTTGGLRLLDDVEIVYGTGGDAWEQGEQTNVPDETTTTLFSVTMGDGTITNIVIDYGLQYTDGSAYQGECGQVHVSIVDTSGGVTATINETTSQQALSSGTLTSTFSVDTTDDGTIEVQLNCNTSLTSSSNLCRWKVTSLSSTSRTLAPNGS